MSESESGEDVDAEGEIDEGAALSYPLEGRFRDEKDRREIMALPEFQREQILAERQDKALKEKQDAHLSLLLKRQNEVEAKNADKRKRKTTDSDEGPRKASRTARSKQLEAVDAFKKKREEDLKDRETGANRRKRPSPGDKGSDIDAEGESDVEWADATKRREDPPAELKDYQRVRVGRTNFAQVCFYPGFEETITGCFARACVGTHPETGRNDYRMAQIKSFEPGKPYQMETTNGKMFWVDQYVRLVHGSSEKTSPFTACSDSEFTDPEFNRYKISMANDGVRLPIKAQLTKTLEGIHNLLNRQWTDADIHEKLAKQNKLAHLNKTAPPNGVMASAEKKAASEADRLHQLNIQNRKKNAEDVRKALIAEKRAAAAARAAAKEREELKKTKLSSLQVPRDGLDSELFGSDMSRAGTPGIGSGVDTPKRGSTPLGVKKEKKTGLPTFKKKVMDDEIIGSMDLGIEIDI